MTLIESFINDLTAYHGTYTQNPWADTDENYDKENFNKEPYAHRFVMEKETKDGYIYKEKTVAP